MRSRAFGGAVLCAVGGVWIAQGTGALGGSFMSGESLWAVIGAVAVVAGLGILAWAWRARA